MLQEEELHNDWIKRNPKKKINNDFKINKHVWRTFILRICIRVRCVLQTNETDEIAKLEPIQYPKQTRKLVPINVPSS
jgi:hypothetical protein